MRPIDLPSTHGYVSNGQQLAIQLTKAISAIEVQRMRSKVEPVAAAKLKTFLQGAIDALDDGAIPPVTPTTPTDPTEPTDPTDPTDTP